MSKQPEKTMAAPGCESCGTHSCSKADESGYPPFCLTTKAKKEQITETINLYMQDGMIGRIARASAGIEGEFYGRMCRVEETVEFIKRMGYRNIGIASCLGLLPETRAFTRILDQNGIVYHTVGCKIGAVDKTAIGILPEQKVNHGCGYESMCNPVMQAKTLESFDTDFNIVIGLCVGHDSLFLMHSHAPVTVLLVKDRVLGHNPAVALYQAEGMYSRFKKK